LSGPHDRYGARIAWIATFTAAIAVLRAVNNRLPSAKGKSPWVNLAPAPRLGGMENQICDVRRSGRDHPRGGPARPPREWRRARVRRIVHKSAWAKMAGGSGGTDIGEAPREQCRREHKGAAAGNAGMQLGIAEGPQAWPDHSVRRKMKARGRSVSACYSR